MVFTFLAILTLAVMHFFYEGIILPSIRLSLRYKLFALRDQLRALLGRSGAAGDVFLVQQSAINNSIKILNRIDTAMMATFSQQMRADDSMRRRVEKRVKIVENYECEDFQKIVAETHRIFRLAAISNMGGCCFYVVPIFALCLCFDKLKVWAKDIVSVPEGELAKAVGLDLAFA